MTTTTLLDEELARVLKEHMRVSVEEGRDGSSIIRCWCDARFPSGDAHREHVVHFLLGVVWVNGFHALRIEIDRLRAIENAARAYVLSDPPRPEWKTLLNALGVEEEKGS